MRPAGFVVLPWTKQGTERGSDQQNGELISVGLIWQADGLFALTNIDDDLDRKCVNQSDGLATPARPATKRQPARSSRTQVFMSDGSRGRAASAAIQPNRVTIAIRNEALPQG